MQPTRPPRRPRAETVDAPPPPTARSAPLLPPVLLALLTLPVLSAAAAAQGEARDAAAQDDSGKAKSASERAREPGSTPAQEEAAAYPALEDIVVSADRGVPLTYPGGRDVLEPETLRTYPDGAIPTALRRIPGVYLQPENGNDARIHVGLRGNDPRRSGLTAILVDGIPVAEAPYGNTDIDGLPIAFERVWRIDVIRGGASIRYGPNSAGGVVNFLTEPIPESPFLRVGARYGSNSERAVWTTAGGTYERLGVLVSGVRRAGDGFRQRSDYVNSDGSIKLRYALSDTETLSGSVSRFDEPHSNQAGGLTRADYDRDPDQSTRHDNFFTFDQNRYVLRYENQLDPESAFQVFTWWQRGLRSLTDVRPVVPPFTQSRVQRSDYSSGGIEARYTWHREIGGMKHSFYHSARYLAEENDEFYYRRDLATDTLVQPFDLHALFRGRAFSLFNEDRIALTDDVDWGLGFRLESIVLSGLSRDSGDQIFKDYTELLPETNVAWSFRPDSAVYGSYQKTFYPPQYETGFDPASVLFAPTRPESSDAYELGVRTRAVEGLEASAALFETRFTDKIDFVNTTNGKVPVNSGDAVSRGIELGATYDLGASVARLSGLSVYGSLTEQRSKITSGANDGNDTPDAPRHLASWGLEYQHESSGLWGRVGGSYSAKAYKDPANTPTGTPDGLAGPVPSFVLWDAAVGWHQHPDGSGFSVTVGGTNLLDAAYFRRFATGIYPGAPRLFAATVSYSVAL